PPVEERLHAGRPETVADGLQAGRGRVHGPGRASSAAIRRVSRFPPRAGRADMKVPAGLAFRLTSGLCAASGRAELSRRPLDHSHLLSVAGCRLVALTGHLTSLNSRPA